MTPYDVVIKYISTGEMMPEDACVLAENRAVARSRDTAKVRELRSTYGDITLPGHAHNFFSLKKWRSAICKQAAYTVAGNCLVAYPVELVQRNDLGEVSP